MAGGVVTAYAACAALAYRGLVGCSASACLWPMLRGQRRSPSPGQAARGLAGSQPVADVHAAARWHGRGHAAAWCRHRAGGRRPRSHASRTRPPPLGLGALAGRALSRHWSHALPPLPAWRLRTRLAAARRPPSAPAAPIWWKLPCRRAAAGSPDWSMRCRVCPSRRRTRQQVLCPCALTAGARLRAACSGSGRGGAPGGRRWSMQLPARWCKPARQTHRPRRRHWTHPSRSRRCHPTHWAAPAPSRA